jgi:hypothetical protein
LSRREQHRIDLVEVAVDRRKDFRERLAIDGARARRQVVCEALRVGVRPFDEKMDAAAIDDGVVALTKSGTGGAIGVVPVPSRMFSSGKCRA